jgi:hypothetical protein
MKQDREKEEEKERKKKKTEVKVKIAAKLSSAFTDNASKITKRQEAVEDEEKVD